jgi:peptide/nickel transport system substrate-binding protein
MAFGLSACSSDDESGDASTSAATSVEYKDTFTWGVETEPASFNPFINSQDAAGPILRSLYDAYFYLDGDGVYNPWLAESHEISADNRTITIKIKQGITFSDGEKLDADAAILNFTRTQDPAIVESTTWAASLASVEKIDEYTFKLVLKEPDTRLLERLSGSASAPISPKDFNLDVADLKLGVAIHGTGPYAITTYAKGEQVVLTARDDYNWAPEALTGRNGPAYTKTVIYRFLGEASTRSGALQSGQVDAIDSVPSQDVALFVDDSKFQYAVFQNGGTPYTLFFNVSRPPFDDIRVRQAIQLAVDIDTIVNAVYYGTAQAAKSPISSASPFYDASVALTPDVAKANSLLDEAGYATKDAEGYRVNAAGERLSIPIESNSLFVRDSRDILNQAIAGQIKELLGVDYTWKSVDGGTWSDNRANNTYVAWDNSVGAADVANPLAVQYNSNPAIGFINLGQIHDPKVDELLATGQENFDFAIRKAAYVELQHYVLVEQAYVLPLVIMRHSHAAAADATGFLSDPARGANWGAYNVRVPK